MLPLYKQFRSVIFRQKFVEQGEHLLIGVSGGLDSMVLADLFLKLKKDIPFDLNLAHVNYGLRGKESDAQEKLVRECAEKNKLGFFVTKPDKKCLALFGGGAPKVPGSFCQARARDFRYHFFAETALAIGASKIAVAHHLEDQVETILGQLIRGTSLKGLGGMYPEREIRNSKFEIRNKSEIRNPKLIRPLLGFSKEVLRQYAADASVSFIEDSSNVSPKYWRNRIRSELLPVIQNLRPRALEKITRLGKEMREVSEFLAATANAWLAEFGKKENNSFWLPRPRFVLLPKSLRSEILYQAYFALSGEGKDLKRDHLDRCDQICLGKENGYYSLPNTVRFTRNGGDLLMKSIR